MLGSGNFGEVRAGVVRIGGELKKAAIKMLKGTEPLPKSLPYWNHRATGHNI